MGFFSFLAACQEQFVHPARAAPGVEVRGHPLPAAAAGRRDLGRRLKPEGLLLLHVLRARRERKGEEHSGERESHLSWRAAA